MKGYNKLQFKINLHLAYFNKGFTLLNYFKYLLAILGVGAAMVKTPIYLISLVAASYAFLCYFLGWLWINKGWLDAENDVQNKFNPFVKDMRYSVNRKA